MGDFAISQKEIDRHDALASQEGSVETRDKPGSRGKQEPDAGATGCAGEMHGDSGGTGGELFVGSGAGFVAGCDLVGRLLRVGEQRFDEHGNIIAFGGMDAKAKPET